MISLFNHAALKRALNPSIRADLKEALHSRIRHSLSAGLGDLTHILVVEGPDTEQMILDELGFTPFANPIDGVRFGSPGFLPGWDFVRDLGAWFEIIWTIGDSGYAVIIFAEDGENPIAGLCRAFVRRAP